VGAAECLVALVALPGLVFLSLGALWLVGVPLPERWVVRVTKFTFVACTFLMLILAWRGEPVRAPLGYWFHTADYRFPLMLTLDWISLPFVAITVILTGLIANFSARYLHREPGFLRFFLLLNLFGFGSLLLFTAGSLDLLVGGWELVGLTSVLLIAFFYQRPDPVRNAGRVFATYRAADIGLLTAAVLLYHMAGTTDFESVARLTPSGAMTVGLLLLLTAAGKSAQFPFSGWLPRAMEGPTPSSAIFYGAISVHAGAYLLLRIQPWIEHTPAGPAIAVMGILTAVMGALAGRVCPDAKSALAYGSVTQVGLIFAEIGFGFPRLAIWHCCGHAVVRTLHFLRAPSALHEFHQVHAAAGGHLPAGLLPLENSWPAGLRNWLYRLALDRGHLDAILDRWVAIPLRRMSHLLNPVSGGAAAAPGKIARRQVLSPGIAEESGDA
jgi:NADH-quinone oxidoreductase subunit L